LGVSFSRHFPVPSFGRSGTDAWFSLESRHFDGRAPPSRVSLDQESPGSSPGGAIRRSDTASVGRAFSFLARPRSGTLAHVGRRPLSPRSHAADALPAGALLFCRCQHWTPRNSRITSWYPIPDALLRPARGVARAGPLQRRLVPRRLRS